MTRRFMSEEGIPIPSQSLSLTDRQYIHRRTNPNLSFENYVCFSNRVMGKSLSNREDSTSTGILFCLKNKLPPTHLSK